MTGRARYIVAVWSVIILANGCKSPDTEVNPLAGQWTSLWSGSKDKHFDFEIIFERDKSFHVEVTGMQIKPETVHGKYHLVRDTLMIMDLVDEPTKLCNYNEYAIYTFAKHGDTLLLNVVKDLCELRKLTLEMGLLKKSNR